MSDVVTKTARERVVIDHKAEATTTMIPAVVNHVRTTLGITSLEQEKGRTGINYLSFVFGFATIIKVNFVWIFPFLLMHLYFLWLDEINNFGWMRKAKFISLSKVITAEEIRASELAHWPVPPGYQPIRTHRRCTSGVTRKILIGRTEVPKLPEALPSCRERQLSHV